VTRVAGILLAAGDGTRLGRPKATVELAGLSLAERGVRLLRDGGADPVLVVTGAVPVEIPGTLRVHNPDWLSGMGSSLATGLRALAGAGLADAGLSGPGTAGVGAAGPDAARPELAGPVRSGPELAVGGGADVSDVTAVVIALADQPLIGPEAVRRLIAAHDAGAAVAVAAYQGRHRNPVLIGRRYWAEVLQTAGGDTGARPFLRSHPGLVTVVECGDVGAPDDIDTLEDLARVRAKLARDLPAACPVRGAPRPWRVPGLSGGDLFA
jgi:CTP:molybdopterin cytidylyltransferase MocA